MSPISAAIVYPSTQAADAEEVADGTGRTVREQGGVDAVLQARAVVDEVQAEAGTLALGPHRGVGHPDGRDELATGELGQYPGVDLVGLASKRRESLHLRRVRDLDLPAVKLELVVDEAGAGHRLDRRLQRLPMPGNARAHFDRLAGLVEQVKVETLAAEIQTSVQHGNGPPCGRSRWSTRRLPPRRPFFIAFLTMRFDGQPVATQWQRIRLDLAVFEPRRFATASAC
jgi:plasmid stabilization system protein ParE